MTEEEIQKNSEHWYNKYKELEKENAELRNNGFTVSAMTEQQLKVAIEKGEQLEQENTELDMKRKAERKIFQGIVEKKNEQLTKAKEIIKKFSEFANNEIEYDPEHPQEHTDLWNALCEQAEQFLKEIEK